MWTVRLIFLWIFAVAAVYYDLRYRSVPNRLILYAAAGGLTLAAAGGWVAYRAGLCGMVLGFALLFPAFLLRMVGGGDVKSLAVIGIATGPGLLWVSFMRGVVAGGLAGVLLLAVRRWRRAGKKKGGPRSKDTAWTLPYAGILSLCAAVSALFY
jgi:prepilin peptidase CpaA